MTRAASLVRGLPWLEGRPWAHLWAHPSSERGLRPTSSSAPAWKNSPAALATCGRVTHAATK